MKSSRRRFIKQGAITLAGSALLSKTIFAAKNAGDHILGIQLYSVRDDMSKDPLGTLKQLSAMGYHYVEHANYHERKFYGYSAEEFKKILTDLNMSMLSGHTVMSMEHWDDAKNDFTDVWKHTVEDASAVGQKYVISPWLDENVRKDMELLKKSMNMFNKCGELCKQYNMKFGYHNHNFEFDTMIGNERLYDYILKNTDPALVAQQMDIGNMYGAGGRALEILKQYPGRFESMHVKDEIESGKGEMNDKYESTILGKGIIAVKEVVDYARKNGGTKHFIIEQESYQDKTPLECAKEDLEIMKKWGY
jgi:sugar phosphate isomerase/epimerase